MRLQTKLVMAFLFLAMVPLASSYWRLTVDVYDTITVQRDLFRYEQLESLARQLDWNLNQAAQSLRLGLESFDLTRLEEVEREGLLRILYEQRPYLNAIRLLDSRGQSLGPVVRIRDQQSLTGTLAGHIALANDEVAVLEDPELIQRAKEEQIAWGAPFVVQSAHEQQLPLFMAFTRNDRVEYMVAALLSAKQAAEADRSLKAFSESRAQTRATIYLRDQNGMLLAQVKDSETEGGEFELPPMLSQWLKEGNSGQIETEIAGVPQIVAWHRLEKVGWRVISVQPARLVEESVRKPMRFVLYWSLVSVVIAVVYGFYFSKTLSTPIRHLAAGVLEVARGNLDARVKVQTRDEVGELAETFNYMAGELKSQKAEIERQSEEIRNWNRELQARVEARTRELKEAQGYLIHTQKLAAVAELGSGVAHELNNPLAAILGFVQILVAQHAEAKEGKGPDPQQTTTILKRVEEQTQRCRNIVHHLLRFSQEQVDRGSYDVVDIVEVVGTVLKLFEGAFSSQKVEIDNRLRERELYSWGNRAQLLQAFLQLFSAVRSVLTTEQNLLIDGNHDEAQVRLVISGPLRELEARETDPFRQFEHQDQVMAQGLGLWVAREIFQEHQGGLEIEIPAEIDEPGTARVVIVLPYRAKDRAQDGAA